MLHSQAEPVLAFLGCGGSCRVLAVLGSCSTGVQQPLRAGADTWASENLRGSSTGQLNWQDCLGMEEDIAWLGRGCSSFSGLQSFSRGLGVLGAALQGCSPSRWQADQGWESPCSGQLPANGEASPPGWQSVSGPA